MKSHSFIHSLYYYIYTFTGAFLPAYLHKGILDEDPFEVIDEVGVGQLIKNSAEAGRAVRAKLGKPFKAGVCGEHGGDPKSVRFFVRIGLDYVSCSPLRVPIARLAAAQCVVEDEIAKEEEADKVPKKALNFDIDNDKKTFLVTNTFSPFRA